MWSSRCLKEPFTVATCTAIAYVALHVFKNAHSGTHVAQHASENLPTFTNGTVHTGDTSGDVYFSGTFAFSQSDKKLSYRRVTARCVLPVVIFQLPRNTAETTYTTSPDQADGMKLEV